MHLTQWPLHSTSLARTAPAKSWFLHSDRWTDRPFWVLFPLVAQQKADVPSVTQASALT